MVASASTSKDGRVIELVTFLTSSSMVSVTLVNCGRSASSSWSQIAGRPSSFSWIWPPQLSLRSSFSLTACGLLTTAYRWRHWWCLRSTRKGTPIGFCMQCLLKARKELCRMRLFTNYSKVMPPYMLPESNLCQFRVPSAHSEGQSPLSLDKTLLDVARPYKRKESVDTSAFQRLSNRDDALRYVT